MPNGVGFRYLLLNAFYDVYPMAFQYFLRAMCVQILSPTGPRLLRMTSSLVIIRHVSNRGLLALCIDRSRGNYGVLVPILRLNLIGRGLRVQIVSSNLLRSEKVGRIVGLLYSRANCSIRLPSNLVRVLCVFHRNE